MTTVFQNLFPPIHVQTVSPIVPSLKRTWDPPTDHRSFAPRRWPCLRLAESSSSRTTRRPAPSIFATL